MIIILKDLFYHILFIWTKVKYVRKFRIIEGPVWSQKKKAISNHIALAYNEILPAMNGVHAWWWSYKVVLPEPNITAAPACEVLAMNYSQSENCLIMTSSE